MYGLDLINTSVLGALGCDMSVFLRYFPAAETMYEIFVALAIGLILLIWIWNLVKNFGLGLGTEAEVMEITHFERGNGLISTNNNNVTVEIKCSQLEKELITTDRRELLELLEKKEHQSHEAEPDDLSGQYGDNTPTISIPD